MQIGLSAEHVVQLFLALLIDLHFLDCFLQLKNCDLVFLSQLCVLVSKFGQITCIELLIDYHELFEVEREEVSQQYALRGEHPVPELDLVVTAVAEVHWLATRTTRR